MKIQLTQQIVINNRRKEFIPLESMNLLYFSYLYENNINGGDFYAK